MNSIVRFNPQSQSFVGHMPNGTWAARPVTNSPAPPRPQVLSQHPVATKPATKIL